jgi:hypothetical protein
MAVQIRSRRPVIFINGARAALCTGSDSETKEGVGLGGKADDRQVAQGQERDDGPGSVPTANHLKKQEAKMC